MLAFAEFAFDVIPSDGALYKEPLADPYAFVSRIHIQKALESDLRPTHIRSAVTVYNGTTQLPTQYINLPYDQGVIANPGEYSTYLHMRMGVSASLLRFRFEGEKIPSIDAEISIAGALNTIFNIFSNSNALEFDGTWFVGANTQVADKYLLRFGMHHFSGHYGDETLDLFYNNNLIDFNEFSPNGESGKINSDFAGKNPSYDYYLHNLVEYVRDNYWIIGASADLPYGFRVYGEFEWPWAGVWLRPFSSNPIGHETQDGLPLIDYVGMSSEGFTEEQVTLEKQLKTGHGYNALRAHTGIEFRYSFKNVGTVFASFDIQFHQDGQTKHMPNSYSPDNPWEKEYSFVGGLELGDLVPGKNVRIEIGYHNGRVNGVNFFYQRSKVVSVGLSIS